MRVIARATAVELPQVDHLVDYPALPDAHLEIPQGIPQAGGPRTRAGVTGGKDWKKLGSVAALPKDHRVQVEAVYRAFLGEVAGSRAAFWHQAISSQLFARCVVCFGIGRGRLGGGVLRGARAVWG